jgi:putative membrane protein
VRFSLRLLLRFALTTALVAVIARVFPEYLVITGGWPAFIAVGALITLLNLFLRPILAVIALPFKLLFTLVTVIVVNLLFLYITQSIAALFDPNVATVTVQGGIVGWLVLAIALGLGNWGIVKLV